MNISFQYPGLLEKLTKRNAMTYEAKAEKIKQEALCGLQMDLSGVKMYILCNHLIEMGKIIDDFNARLKDLEANK